MKKKSDSKLMKVLGLLLLVAFIGFYDVTAVLDIAGSMKPKNLGYDFTSSDICKKGYVSADTHYGSSLVLTMHNSVNFIPTGKEYYYLIINDDADTAVYVRADKKFGDQFTDGVNKDGVKVSGKIRSLDSKVKHELSSQITDLKANGMKVPIITSDVLYIDAVAKKQAILRMVATICVILGIVGIIYASARKITVPGEVASSGPKIAGAFSILLLIGGLMIVIHTLNFM